jgi:hypothetical protein
VPTGVVPPPQSLRARGTDLRREFLQSAEQRPGVIAVQGVDGDKGERPGRDGEAQEGGCEAVSGDLGEGGEARCQVKRAEVESLNSEAGGAGDKLLAFQVMVQLVGEVEGADVLDAPDPG